MFKSISFLLCAFILLNLASCSNKSKKPVIGFSADSSSIIINNIDDVSFLQAKKLYQTNPDSVNFISVLIVPTDIDTLQREEKIPGKITFLKKDLVFSPNTPFKIGETYLVESYIGVQFASVKKMFNNDVKSNLAPQQQLLTR